MFIEVVIALLGAALAQGAAFFGPKIIGGSAASLGEIPWQVALQTSEGVHFCGGTIISSEWVLSTARCTQDRSANQLAVAAGSVDRKSPKSIHKVTEVHMHPDFQSLSLKNDVAVLRVTPPFQFDSDIAPVTLATSKAPTGLVATVSGWGTTFLNGPVQTYLLKAEVPIYNHYDCNTIYSLLGGVPSDQICAGTPQGGVDACSGDAGGPLVADGVLYGVVSWGYGCAGKYPGIYTDVTVHRSWIQNKTGV